MIFIAIFLAINIVINFQESSNNGSYKGLSREAVYKGTNKLYEIRDLAKDSVSSIVP